MLKKYKYKLLTHFVVFSLLVIVIGKYYFARTGNSSLFIYGVTVSIAILVNFLIAFVFYKDPYLESLEKNNFASDDYFVSIMVAAKNEEQIIERCVESLINQNYNNKEIIFVDDASTDRTGKLLDKYAKEKLIKVIHIKDNVGKKKALAKAMLKAKGNIFAFSDSDSVVAKDAIYKIVEVFKSDPLIGAVSGHCRALNGDKNILTKIQDSWYEGQFSIRKAFESYFGVVTCVSGPLAVFRKEAIYNFIPAWENDSFLGQEFRFATDRTLTGFVLGNKYIGKKIKAKYKSSPFVKKLDFELKEWKVVYCKAAKVWTNVPDTFSRVIRQQVRWKKSFIRNIFFTGLFYWRKPIIPALNYYLHIVFVVMGPFIAFRHLVYLPINGNIFSAFLYFAGIIFVGFMFGLAFKLENRESHKWIYRPLMSMFSTMILSWLLFYSAFTIRRMVWSRK